MRLLLASVGVAWLWGTTGAAIADGEKGLALSDEEQANVSVLSDGAGHFFVVMKPGRADSWLYYGDAKTLDKQRIGSAGGEPAAGRYSWGFVAPGYRSSERALRAATGWSEWTVTCGEREAQLSEVSEEVRERLLAEATFRPPRWKRRVYLLARDRRGTYFYVDTLRGRRYGMRLFVGRTGKMRERRLSDLVSDSEGDIFFARRGKLRIDGGLYSKERKATWIRGKRREELVVLDAWKNTKLIYGELGVYKGVRFGTPCDDF